MLEHINQFCFLVGDSTDAERGSNPGKPKSNVGLVKAGNSKFLVVCIYNRSRDFDYSPKELRISSVPEQ